MAIVESVGSKAVGWNKTPFDFYTSSKAGKASGQNGLEELVMRCC